MSTKPENGTKYLKNSEKSLYFLKGLCYNNIQEEEILPTDSNSHKFRFIVSNVGEDNL